MKPRSVQRNVGYRGSALNRRRRPSIALCSPSTRFSASLRPRCAGRLRRPGPRLRAMLRQIHGDGERVRLLTPAPGGRTADRRSAGRGDRQGTLRNDGGDTFLGDRAPRVGHVGRASTCGLSRPAASLLLARPSSMRSTSAGRRWPLARPRASARFDAGNSVRTWFIAGRHARTRALDHVASIRRSCRSASCPASTVRRRQSRSWHEAPAPALSPEGSRLSAVQIATTRSGPSSSRAHLRSVDVTG